MTDNLKNDVFIKKYQHGNETIHDMHIRMAKEFARIRAVKDKSKSLKQWESYFLDILKDFKKIVPQGSVMAILGTNIIGSLSNCFVIGQPYDSYSGILHKDEELISLMKRRGGVGLDLSTLRPAKTSVQNAAKTSTGATSFMERYSNSTREVAQGGRRGALMLTIDVRHPDVLSFINAKQDRTKVTGANISVMLRDDFMEAVKNDEDYILRWPCNYDLSEMEECQAEYNQLFPITNIQGENIAYYKRVKAKEIYDAIVHNAWDNAEPGQMFIDRHWNYSPDAVYPQYKGITTNPCGEIFMQTYDACRLILINLENYINEDKSFNYEDFTKDCYEMQLMADDLVDLELEYIDRILNKLHSDPEPTEIKKREISLWLKIKFVAESSRRTGCGITGLGDAMAKMGLAYTDIEIIKTIMKAKLEAELSASIDMAKKYGPFKGWNPELEYERTKEGLKGKNEFYDMLLYEFPELVNNMLLYGRRNVSWSTVAPAGTVSIMTETTSGIEPLFAPYYTRRRKINPDDKDRKADFIDQNGDSWVEYPVFHTPFKKWVEMKSGATVREDEMSTEDAQAWFEESPWYRNTANELFWKERLKVQAIVQRYISHSISSTINLPEGTTPENINNIYMKAWEYGLKGVTVYRENSRTGVLINKEKEIFKQHDAPKRPKDLEGDIHVVSVKNVKYNVIVGLLNKQPYEVFAHFNEGTSVVPDKTIITKQKSGEYVYKSSKTISVSKDMDDAEEALTRMTSTALRHGTNTKFIVEQLNKTKGDLTSFSKAIARVLKKYIPDGTSSSLTCLDCQSKDIIFEEGCEKCLNCGSSKCG